MILSIILVYPTKYPHHSTCGILLADCSAVHLSGWSLLGGVVPLN